MKRFDLSVKIEVPSDPFEAADIITKIRAPWEAMLASFRDAGVKFESHEAPVSAREKGAELVKRAIRRARTGTDASTTIVSD